MPLIEHRETMRRDGVTVSTETSYTLEVSTFELHILNIVLQFYRENIGAEFGHSTAADAQDLLRTIDMSHERDELELIEPSQVTL
jgi:hypothetical protein